MCGSKSQGSEGVEDPVAQCIPQFPAALLTMLGLSLGSLLGGPLWWRLSLHIPVGNLAVSAITAYDYPLIQGYVLWISLIYMVVNLIVDISYNLVDPRMKEKR